MVSSLTLLAFCLCLLVCMAAGVPLAVALAAGFLLFFAYGMLQAKVSARDLLRSALAGLRSVAGILLAFMFIGMLTASWRASGTIPTIVADCMQLVRPQVFPMAAFLMVGLMSVLTGTSFGTAATMGSICMALGNVLGCNPVVVGGAILAGCYVGDRCSPLSTASLLVAQITKTDFSRNLGLMARRAVVPVVVSCLVYALLGFVFPAAGEGMVELPYVGAFDLGWIPLLPALSVLVLALLRVDVRVNMAASTVLAVGVALLVQQADGGELARQLVLGYEAPAAELASLNGGGMVSMVQPAFIIMISSTYAGLFETTGLLDGLKAALGKLTAKVGREAALALSGLSICGLCCNQTLSSILTQQLFQDQYEGDNQALALDIEDTTIVLCGLVPWCIACSVPLAAVGAPMASIVAACYLYLQPLWMILRSRRSTPGA